MPKKRIDPEPEADDQDAQPEPSPAQQLEQSIADDREGSSISAIEEVLQSVEEQQGQFAVKRFDPLSGKQLHLERMTISILKDYGQDPSEFLKSRYGGGQYNLVFYVPQAGGGWRQYTARRFEIDTAIPPGEFFRAQREAQHAADPSRPDETLLSKMFDKVKTEGGGHSEFLLGLMQMQAKQSADMMGVMMKASADTMTAITSMFAALKGGGSDKGLDLLNALAVFDKLKGKDNSFDPIRLLELAHKWFKDHDRDDDDDEPGWLKALAAFLPSIMPQQMRQLPSGETALPARAGGVGPPGPGPTRGNPVIDANGQPQPSAQASAPPKPPMLREFLKQIYPVLIAKIQAGVTPDDVYDWLNNPLMADAFTDTQYDELEALFRLPTWETELFGDAKLIEPHKVWFEGIRTLFLEPEATQ